MRIRELSYGGVLVFVLGATLLLATGCGGGDGNGDGGGAGGGGDTLEDLDMRGEDFECVLNWDKVDKYLITNKLGHLDEALQAARSPTGGEFPTGTIIQIIPTEAMVKRRSGWNPGSNDWEFFRLGVSAAGTVIIQRGDNTRNPIHPGPCIECHLQADPQWDFVCAEGHGCDPLPPIITDQLIENQQQNDPRCR